MDPATPGRCSACFFTTDFPGVTLEADGRCSVCHGSRIAEELAAHLTSGLEDLRQQAARWREQRQGRYDCVIGGSGGLDSSYVIWIAKRLLGLNPLVVKYDHGFNHEAADRNVRALCAGLGVDLEIVKSRGRHDARYVRNMALAFRPTGLYWAADAARQVLDLLPGDLGPSVANVVDHAAGKEERNLGDDPQLPAIRCQIQRADVLAVDPELAALELIEAADQLDQGRFAGAGVPNQGQALAGRDVQLEVLENWLPGVIAKVEVIEGDLAAQTWDETLRILHHSQLGVDQGENALGRR